jgi:hypothetical protein
MNHEEEFVCNVKCGDCCKLDDVEDVLPECYPLQENGYCKHSSLEGCNLSREERPKICNQFSCQLARWNA